MAAEQIPGRVCGCGCGQSLDGMHRSAKWAVACRDKVALERKRRAHQAQRPRRMALNPGERRVIERHEVNKNRAQALCLVCFGMPWARRPERLSEGRPGYEKPVTGDNGLCRGCGEEWGPEPEPDRIAILQSSAGMTARHGALHGMDVTDGRGKHERKAKNG